MELSRQEYPAMLASLDPSQAVNILNARLNHVSKTNQDIANWLEERRRVEETYVQGLRRLARKEPPDAESELGVLTSPWQKIVEAARELANSHHEFASRIENDIILSLRQFDATNREMQQMSTIQGNLASMAREYDQAQKKASKLKAQGGKASAGKVAGASDQVDSAAQQWESQAPYVFEQLQAVDESRLNHMRDVLTQLETHEVDHVEKAKVQAESCLNSLLNLNVGDEIQSWSARRQAVAAQRTPSRAEAQRTPSRDDRPPLPSTTSRMERRLSRNISGSNTLAPPPPLAPNGDDRTSQREPSVNEEKKRPRGLKRLGTVFNRRRQSMMPSLRPTPGRHKSRLGSNTDLPEELPALPTPPPPAQETRDQPSPGPPTAFTEPGPAATENRLQPARPHSERPVSHGAMTNGVSRLQEPLVPAPTSSPSASQHPPQIQPLHEASATTTTTTTNDNFTTPPQSAATDPITAAQREAAAAGASGYTEFPDQAQQQQAFNLSIRNAPITEESSAANTAAMADVASTLRAQAPRRTGTLRGRRDVRSTVYVPSDQAPVFGNAAPPTTGTGIHSTWGPTTASPLTTPSALTSTIATSPLQQPARPFAIEDRTSSDTQSIRSGRSLASTATTGGLAVRHPDMHTPGLSSSIIETVNATFESGKLTKGAVIGELALAHTPDPTSNTPPTRETIRLENFPILEKIAPNPAFVRDLGQGTNIDRKGEYTVDLQALSARPNVAFKYQLHADASDPTAVIGKHAPLVVAPSWKCEEKQTSVIVSYSLNPRSGFGSGEVTLHNVILGLYLEGSKATQCQSKPAGTFARDKGMIYWRFEELRLSSSQGPQKALARFTTEGTGKPGRVEGRWEISSISGAKENSLGVSRLEERGVGGTDPFADESGATSGSEGRWTTVGGARKMVSGSYVGV